MICLNIPGPGDEKVALEILVDRGALCVAGVWDFELKQRRAGLYAIYHKATGCKLGPFYAHLPKAQEDLKKIAQRVPGSFWLQPIGWLQRQRTFFDWIEKEIGKDGDLIGGEWETE